MQATHYIEQFRENSKSKIVQGPVKEIKNLPASLKLSKSGNCKTIAVWKITLKPSLLITGEEINGTQILIVEEIKS